MDAGQDFERLYDEHAQALYAFVLNLTRSEADTKDILQDVFVKIARRPELLDSVRNPRAFLLQLAHHRVIDAARRHAARDRYQAAAGAELDMFVPGPESDIAAYQRALRDALAVLPSDQRAVVHLKLWEDLTFEEIGQALDISPNTAASRYRYGLDKLRTRLRPLYEEIR